MTAEQFTYWLQGYAELNDAPPSEQQWQAIRDHLALVFNKVTPQRVLEGLPGTPVYQSPSMLQPLRATCSTPGGMAPTTIC